MIDMYRDRLEFVHGELADAKQRSLLLESSRADDKTLLTQSTKKLADTGQ